MVFPNPPRFYGPPPALVPPNFFPRGNFAPVITPYIPPASMLPPEIREFHTSVLKYLETITDLLRSNRNTEPTVPLVPVQPTKDIPRPSRKRGAETDNEANKDSSLRGNQIRPPVSSHAHTTNTSAQSTKSPSVQAKAKKQKLSVVSSNVDRKPNISTPKTGSKAGKASGTTSNAQLSTSPPSKSSNNSIKCPIPAKKALLAKSPPLCFSSTWNPPFPKKLDPTVHQPNVGIKSTPTMKTDLQNESPNTDFESFLEYRSDPADPRTENLIFLTGGKNEVSPTSSQAKPMPNYTQFSSLLATSVREISNDSADDSQDVIIILPEPISTSETVLPQQRATPETVQPQPIFPSKTVLPQPVSTPKTVQPQPRSTPETIEPQPRSTPETIEPQPISTPKAVQPQPRSTPKTVLPQPISTPKTVQPQPRSTPKTGLPQQRATPKTVQPQPRSTPKTVLPQPISTPKTVQPQPRSTPKTVLPQPISTPKTVQPQPRSTPKTVLPQPISTPKTVQPQRRSTPIFVPPQPISNPVIALYAISGDTTPTFPRKPRNNKVSTPVSLHKSRRKRNRPSRKSTSARPQVSNTPQTPTEPGSSKRTVEHPPSHKLDPPTSRSMTTRSMRREQHLLSSKKHSCTSPQSERTTQPQLTSLPSLDFTSFNSTSIDLVSIPLPKDTPPSSRSALDAIKLYK